MILNEVATKPVQGNIQFSRINDFTFAHAANLLINMFEIRLPSQSLQNSRCSSSRRPGCPLHFSMPPLVLLRSQKRELRSQMRQLHQLWRGMEVSCVQRHLEKNIPKHRLRLP